MTIPFVYQEVCRVFLESAKQILEINSFKKRQLVSFYSVSFRDGEDQEW